MSEAKRWFNAGAKNGLWFEVTDGEMMVAVALPESADYLVAKLNGMQDKIAALTLHDRCTREGCGKVLHSIREGRSGLCGACAFQRMPEDTKKSLNRLIAAAFKPTTDADKDKLIDDAMAKVKRDEGKA